MKGRVFVIGASLSGIDTLSRLMRLLPADFPAPILITQHVVSHSPGMLPHTLSGAGYLPATHPKNGERIAPGHIYVAPPDRHMLLQKGYVRLSHGPQENLAPPAIDPLFRSAAIAYGPAAVGIVLTGQLDDGTSGLISIKTSAVSRLSRTHPRRRPRRCRKARSRMWRSIIAAKSTTWLVYSSTLPVTIHPHKRPRSRA